MKQAAIVVAVLVLIGAAFWGGTVYANAGDSASSNGTSAGPGAGFPGGPMADLTDEERAELENMTDEERQAFMAEQFGGELPTGGAGGPGGPGGMRGGTIEGEVLDVAADSITVKVGDGSSQNIYIDADTVVAYAKGAGELAVGSQVLLVAQPEADGVTTAQAVVVK